MVRPSDENDGGRPWDRVDETASAPARDGRASFRAVARAREGKDLLSALTPTRRRSPSSSRRRRLRNLGLGGGSRRVARAPDRPSRERNRDEETIIVLTTATTFLSFHSPLSANHHRDVLEQRR